MTKFSQRPKLALSLAMLAVLLLMFVPAFSLRRTLGLRNLALEMNELGGSVIMAEGRIQVVLSDAADGTWSDDRLAEVARAIRNHRIVDGLLLEGQSISDSSLSHFRSLTQLRELSVSESRITDRGLVYLEPLVNLESLSLCSNVDLRGPGVEHLAGHKHLTTIALRATSYNGSSLASLSQIPRLESLDLGFTRVQDGCLASLSDARSLKRLYLDHTEISDEGLRHLRLLRSLQELNLNHNLGVSDSGLATLGSMKTLQRISIIGTGATAEGVAKLRAALPTCKIDWMDSAKEAKARLAPLLACQQWR